MAVESEDLRRLQVIPRLPNRSEPNGGGCLPGGLVGARILRFGTVDPGGAGATGQSPEGGGLVIDYLPEDHGAPSRVVLAFNELGMWVAYQGEFADPAPPNPRSASVPG
jgi:hypothetical protein